MKNTVYVKLNQITELTHKDVVLKDVAQVYCDDQNIMNKCNAMKVMTVKLDKKRRYIMSALDVTRKLIQMDPTWRLAMWGKWILSLHTNRLPRHPTSGNGARRCLSAPCVFSGQRSQS